MSNPEGLPLINIDHFPETNSLSTNITPSHNDITNSSLNLTSNNNNHVFSDLQHPLHVISTSLNNTTNNYISNTYPTIPETSPYSLGFTRPARPASPARSNRHLPTPPPTTPATSQLNSTSASVNVSLPSASLQVSQLRPVSRVALLDAEQLDSDATHMLSYQFQHATSLIAPNFLHKYQPEFDACIRTLLFFTFQFRELPSPGSNLQSLSLVRTPSVYPTFLASLKAALLGFDDTPIFHNIYNLKHSQDPYRKYNAYSPHSLNVPLPAQSFLAGLPQRLGLHYLPRLLDYLLMRPPPSKSSLTRLIHPTQHPTLPTSTGSPSSPSALRSPSALPLSSMQQLLWLFLTVFVRWAWERGGRALNDIDYDDADSLHDSDNSETRSNTNTDQVSSSNPSESSNHSEAESRFPLFSSLSRLLTALFSFPRLFVRYLCRLVSSLCVSLFGPHWRNSLRRVLQHRMPQVEVFVRMIHVINYFIFLTRGTYRSPVDRIVGCHFMYHTPTVGAALALDVLHQQVVWQVLASVASDIVPTVTNTLSHTVGQMGQWWTASTSPLPDLREEDYDSDHSDHTSDGKNSTTLDPHSLTASTLCVLCLSPPTEPRRTNCLHWYCGYCVRAVCANNAICRKCSSPITGHT